MSAITVKNADRDIIHVFEASDVPVLTAKEIADELEMTRQGANYRLKKLEEKGIVDRKRIGSRAVAWWLTNR